MSAKRMPATSAKLSKGTNSWMDHLKAIIINDDNWRCMVIMIVETLPDHVRYVNLFDEAAEKGSRKAIYSISFKKLMHNIRTLSRVDEDKCSPAQTVFHYANKLISRGESLETRLIADLVKYLVYRAKNEAIVRSRKESDVENDVDRELRAMLTVAKVESQRSMKSLKSKKSERITEAPTTEKANTYLRKRGEEWKDKIYIDDAPENGPDLFILLTGFRDPKLPLELIKAGLPLTCILKIKRPDDCMNFIESTESHMVNDDNVFDHTKNVFGDSDIERKTLFDFWSKLDKSANDPENLEDFSGVIFQTFCPPEIRINDREEEEMMKKNLYDRVSCIVYDLHDLQRLHIDYIRNMKLQSVPIEPPRAFDVYTKIMDSLPTECTFVTVILQAMLTQVEIDLDGNRTSNFDDRRTSRNQRKSDFSMKFKFNESPYRKSVGSSFHGNQISDLTKKHQQRIHDLNIKYGLESNDNQQVKEIMNPEIILAGDELKLKTYHVPLADDIVKLINPKPTSLSDLAIRSLRDTRILTLWRNYKDISDVTKKKYRCHISKITRCFDDQMDFQRIVHYLHLQVFDKMINGGLNRTATRGEDRRIAIMEKGAIPASTRSDPFLLPSKILQNVRTSASEENPISNLRCYESDSIIDYDKSVGDTFECPELFYLTDTREMLQPGFLESRKEKLFARRVDSSPEVSDFTDVRLLPSDVFLQAINECLKKFDGFESSYLETTDSVLLYFDNAHSTTASNTPTEDKVFKHGNRCRRISRIVTPICLRNFCEYVIREENDWIREMEFERAGKRSISAGELTRKLSHHSDIDGLKITTFTDDDFILPNSLKGQARKKNEDISMQIAELALKKSAKLAIKIEKDERSATTKSPKEIKKKDIKTVEVDASSVPMRVPSLRCARDNEPYKFVGYDLGNHRIQIVSESETFVSSDGTVIKVELDQWLYGKKRLGIGVTLEDCFLKLESAVGIHEHNKMPYHLITKNGIVIAFQEAQKFKEENQSFNIRFDFCASWPSGLVVKFVRGNSSVYSSCILQKYISKGPECEPVSRENYRKFLSNGTVLKFLDDETVEVLRPNGTIVRCINFEKTARARDSELEHHENLTKEEISKSKKMRSSMKGLRKASSPRKRSLISATSNPINGEIQSSRDQAGKVKITRYTTLEHDGRHYETVNDEVSRVFDKSLVRTSTDFEVCEKFTRREDGTQSFLNSKGELIVFFPDGTVIKSGFVVEDEPLICDWTDDEFNRFFRNSRKSKPNDEVLLSEFSDASWTSSNRSSIRRTLNQRDKNIILISDAFVSVLMTSRMEHECYATVGYDPVKESYELSMPDEVVVTILRDGLFNLNIGANIELRIRENNLKISSRDCVNNQDISETIYNFPRSEMMDQNLSSILLMTTDTQGNIFTVYADGNVNRNNDAVRSPPKSLHKQCRLFAMSRDLTAYEYLHKSERNEFQNRMNFDARSSVISVPNGKAGGLEYRLFLNPPDPANYSKMWLQRVTKIKQANKNGIDLSPSTYSNPYEWIFPFGRNGNGFRKNTWKISFGEIVEDDRPRVLILTIFESIAEEGKNLLIELQKALACYWRSTIKVNSPLRTCSLLLKNSSTSSEAKINKWLMDLSLGIERNIDMEKYRSGMSIIRTKFASTKFSEAPQRTDFGKQNALIKAEFQLYKECFRKGIILPYFQNIRGVCFHWIMSWVDRAFEYVEKY